MLFYFFFIKLISTHNLIALYESCKAKKIKLKDQLSTVGYFFVKKNVIPLN